MLYVDNPNLLISALLDIAFLKKKKKKKNIAYNPRKQ